MSPITTHILDTARGCPARGVPLTLERRDGDAWTLLASGVTDSDGRVADLLEPGDLTVGLYRMTFQTGAYFESQGISGFYPYVPVPFHIAELGQHYHVPLLLSPYGYSTYRGS